jgi:hypothetical protein
MVKAHDIIKQQEDKTKSKNKIFKKIYNRVEDKIIKAGNCNFNECSYEIPEFILNLPLYNLQDCKQYLIKKLTNDGFNVTSSTFNSISISWKK